MKWAKRKSTLTLLQLTKVHELALCSNGQDRTVGRKERHDPLVPVSDILKADNWSRNSSVSIVARLWGQGVHTGCAVQLSSCTTATNGGRAKPPIPHDMALNLTPNLISSATEQHREQISLNISNAPVEETDVMKIKWPVGLYYVRHEASYHKGRTWNHFTSCSF